MNIINCEQRTDEWYAARLGHATSSRFYEIMHRTSKNGYVYQLAAEKIKGRVRKTGSFKTAEQGIEKEPQARAYYEKLNNLTVETVGFVEKDEWVGASPDGLVDDDGTMEIKCLYSENHIRIIDTKEVPSIFIPQIQGGLWVTERQWCDFVSFDPSLEDWPFECIRVYRDEDFIKELAIQVTMFVSELKTIIEKIENRNCSF